MIELAIEGGALKPRQPIGQILVLLIELDGRRDVHMRRDQRQLVARLSMILDHHLAERLDKMVAVCGNCETESAPITILLS